MPPGRPATRQRVVQNENDENTTTRLTRAKAAAGGPEDASKLPVKGALQPKKAAVNPQRKRAALGDVSNFGKDGAAAEGKKAANAKGGLVSKTAGVQKNVARPATRNAMAPKEATKRAAAVEPRKATATTTTATTTAAATTSTSVGTAQKRKMTATAAQSTREESVNEESEPIRKRPHTMGTEKRTRTEPKVNKENAAPPIRIAAEAEAEADADADAQAKADEEARLQFLEKIKEFDAEDLDDPLMVADYANEIFDYLRDLEVLSIPNPEYMSHQDDLEWKTRGILVDWLIEVHTRFHLLPETLFLAVNVIDRFLSEKVVQLDRLQLVGITAMFIASKYEEVLSPHVENFKRIADNGFSESEILSAERCVLSTLDYDLSYPNPMNFLRRVSKADNYDIQSRTVGKYLMEISLLDHRFMEFRPSHIAAGAMYLARLMLDRGEWDDTLVYYAGYNEEEVDPVVKLMVDYLARPICHEAFFKKYASKKFLKCKLSDPVTYHFATQDADIMIASLLARSWAKKNAAAFGLTDLEYSLDQIS
ncbi:hypothetical protein GMORB2_6917 [Geosmithia morbida]|uniref:G2/mitotic-specific cyclin-B n=1 Tax=Geosmithia morbida TaxID=1094350 RepID=A0A9P4YTN5_9HYPO|nr:uncharacterized protein GMORB2_6917 [Geosmithia morbida]KAF4122610.1 hypothetical protein GMORB2_6917 [Geosmithia morbida]